MERIELGNLLKALLKKKLVLVSTVAIFVIVNLILTSWLIKPNYKSTFQIALTDDSAERIARDVVYFKSSDFISRLQEKYKLNDRFSVTAITLQKNNIIEVTVVAKTDNHEFCDALLTSIFNREKEIYERSLMNYNERIQTLEHDVKLLSEERNRTLDKAEIAVGLVERYEAKPTEELPRLLSQNIYYGRVTEIESKIYSLSAEIDKYKVKIDSLRGPFINQSCSKNEVIGVDKQSGAVLSGFIGLIIGVFIVLLSEYMKS